MLETLRDHPVVSRWRWAAFPFTAWVLSRVGLLGMSGIGLYLVPGLWQEGGPQGFLRQYPALGGLCRWDCGFFELIATKGYWEIGATNFFPLLPLLARGLSIVTRMNLQLALVLVPNLACLAAYGIIYRVFLLVAEEGAARWGLVLFVAYPFAFFHGTGYPESLMVLSTSVAVLLALRGRHIWAGVALGLGVLARHITMLGGAALLAAQLRERGVHPRRFLLSTSVLGLLMPWLLLGTYCLYQYVTFGNALAFMAVRNNWGAMAWWGIGDLVRVQNPDVYAKVMIASVPFAVIPTVGAVALCRRRELWVLGAYAAVALLLFWSVGMWGLGRYSASCWPAFLPLGGWLSRRPFWQGPAVAALAVFQGLFFYLFSHQFPIL